MLKYHAKILGYAGLIPFIMLPFFILWETVSYFEGVGFFIQYSAIILSFLGGVLWFDGINNERSISLLYIAMLPSILAWLSVIWLPPKIALIALACAFTVVIFYEFKLSTLAVWYRSLRIRLTSITVGSHLMMIWLIQQTSQ
ncbi:MULTISPECIES: DUF3429 domain-containing protein [Alteromonadaceae]|uniref:DUF3429 domain-containing protein n=1 Tax=Alteromonadaceae TaxID=72275 RepID=UPI001C0999FD|nr:MULTISPECIES: DUF3429 domain-containing protein [Aliiglaciecola]MBU2876126.1 DUF3429 domain-containing protein [Aliiglaciecola lipolytica]MDO6712220.1 DUF3429 domain-containing protein [Aliiglaciecola sp. 2_MG-2023]MDO6753542.1 DUF3429 domain-containing protein [Aliiglaciecola sp. 1_MG-2023]